METTVCGLGLMLGILFSFGGRAKKSWTPSPAWQAHDHAVLGSLR